MSTVEDALYARLSTFAGLVALGAKVYPKRVPQDAGYPAITYQRISGVRISAMGRDTGLAHPRFQVSAFSGGTASVSAYDHATQIAAQIRAALQRFRGTVAGVEIQDIFIDNDTDIGDPNSEIEGIATDVVVWARES
jgi:hypothetical protein